MGRVIWDGEKIVVDSSRLDLEALESLAEKHSGERLPLSTFYEFPRNKAVVKDLGALSGIIMDESFKTLYDKVIGSEKRKADETNAKAAAMGLPSALYEFQKEAVVQMVESDRNIMLASAPGCGKSCMSALFLAKKENSYPCLLVCPASLKTNWQMEIEKWTPGVKTFVISGRDSYADSRVVAGAKGADIVIINYDILGIDDKEASKREKERIERAKENGWKYRRAFVPVKGWAVEFNEKFDFRTVVCDECQYIESSKAIRTRAVIQVCADSRIKKVFLSGTPFETKLRQFYNACHILAPDLFPKEGDFLFRYCNPVKGHFGWTFDGVSNLEELRRKLSLFMIRHRKEDVLTQLPPKQNIPVYLDMEGKPRKAYDEMESRLLEIKEKMHQFTYLAEMKKALVEIKKDAAVQYVKDMLEIEDKIVVMVYHTEMWEYFMEKFKDIAVGFNGSVAAFKRQDAVNKFQKDKKVRLFIGQITAAATGITLTAAHSLVFVEWGSTTAGMVQASDRIHRISQEAESCQIYYLIVKDTIDEGPLGNLGRHFGDIHGVLDGDKNAQFVDIDESMIAKVKERALMRRKKGLKIEYQS